MPRVVVVHHVLARHRARRDEAGDRSHHPLSLRSRLCCRTRREEAAYGHGALGLDGGPERLGRTAGRETARRRQRRRRRTAAWGGQGSTRGGFARRRLVASGCERDGLGGRASLSRRARGGHGGEAREDDASAGEVGGGGRLVEEDEGEDGGEGRLQREEGGDERRARALVRVRLRRVS